MRETAPHRQRDLPDVEADRLPAELPPFAAFAPPDLPPDLVDPAADLPAFVPDSEAFVCESEPFPLPLDEEEDEVDRLFEDDALSLIPLADELDPLADDEREEDAVPEARFFVPRALVSLASDPLTVWIALSPA